MALDKKNNLIDDEALNDVSGGVMALSASSLTTLNNEIVDLTNMSTDILSLTNVGDSAMKQFYLAGEAMSPNDLIDAQNFIKETGQPLTNLNDLRTWAKKLKKRKIDS